MAFLVTSDYLALPRPAETWIIQDILPNGGCLNIFGQPKMGKSNFSLQMASAIGDPLQGDLLGLPVLSHGPVVYLQIDTPRGLWFDRIQKFFLPSGRTMQDVYHADSLMVPYPFNILDKGGVCRKWLEESLAAVKPLVVIVDTLREAHQGDENDSGHMQQVVNTLHEIVRPAALVLISHPRKPQPDGSTTGLMSENRGSNYVAGRADAILKITSSTIVYASRSAAETTIHVAKTPVLFELSDAISPAILRIMGANPSLNATGLLPLVMTVLPTLSPEAARSRIRRLLAARAESDE